MRYEPFEALELARQSAMSFVKAPQRFLAIGVWALLATLPMQLMDKPDSDFFSMNAGLLTLVLHLWWALVALAAVSTLGWLINQGFGAAAVLGLDVRAQLKLVQARIGPLSSCMIKYFTIISWGFCKPLLLYVPVLVLCGIASLIWQSNPFIGVGVSIVRLLGFLVAALAAFVFSIRATAEVLLSPALVMQGLDAQEAITQAKHTSQHVRGWLIKAYMMACMPMFVNAAVSGMLQGLHAVQHTPPSTSFNVARFCLSLVGLLSAPLTAALPMVAARALEGATPTAPQASVPTLGL